MTARGRSVFVTGGAAGLGASIGAAAAAAGYRVGLFDVDEKQLRATAEALDGAEAFAGSTTDPDAVDRALDAFGTVDVVVNNAGIVRFGPLLDLSVDDWRSVVDVNLTGTFVVARAAAARMIDAGSGNIVNIASMNGVAPGPFSGAYGATKAAVMLLTKQMALEWAPTVRVNAVAPGLIDAGMSEQVYADAATRQAREARVPLGRLGRADDVSDVVLFLASDAARYMTGQTLLVDGGVTDSVITSLPRPKAVDGVGHDR